MTVLLDSVEADARNSQQIARLAPKGSLLDVIDSFMVETDAENDAENASVAKLAGISDGSGVDGGEDMAI